MMPLIKTFQEGGIGPRYDVQKKTLNSNFHLQSVGELAKHCCTASIGQYKKLFKIKAPELKQWVCYHPHLGLYPNIFATTSWHCLLICMHCKSFQRTVSGEGCHEEGLLWSGQ